MLDDYDDKYTELHKQKETRLASYEDGSIGYMEIILIASGMLIAGLIWGSFLAAFLVVLGIALILHGIRLILIHRKNLK